MPSQVGPRSKAQEPDYLALALSEPEAALEGARRVLEQTRGAHERSIAHQAIGIVLRDRDDRGPALRHLRAALRAAMSTGSASRQSDVLASLGVALVLAGRTDEGERTLSDSVAMVSGTELGRVLVRRGGVRGVAGRHEDAIRDLTRAAGLLRRGGDDLWKARALQSRALSHLARGSVGRADHDLGRAEAIFAECGQQLESVFARHNRGLVAYRAGDLPVALTHLEAAGTRYRELAAPNIELVVDRASVLVAAGLTGEAFESLASHADALPRRSRGSVFDTELLLAASMAGLGAGQPAEAQRLAERARRKFRTQRRELWASRADHVVIRARHAQGERGRRLLNAALANVADLVAHGADEATMGHILVGKLAAANGMPDLAREHFGRAALRRRRRPALSRSLGWLGQALRSKELGRSAEVLNACAKGLDSLDEHIVMLGATELRAYATSHGTELAQIGLMEASRTMDPSLLLWWSERWRAIAMVAPMVRPPGDPNLARDLAALREVVVRAERASAAGRPLDHLDRRREELERAVRDRLRQVSGSDPRRQAQPPDLGNLADALGDRVLVELIDIGGELHAVVAERGGATVDRIGSVAGAQAEVQHATFLLRRIARGGTRGDVDSLLDEVGLRLERALLGGVAPRLEARSAVIVPPSGLHSAPWGLVPGLRDAPVSIAPSATAWMRAQESPAPAGGPIVLIAGPGLPGGAKEIDAVEARYPEARVLKGSAARVEDVLAAIDGASIAHIAAHGTFRADSPMFSSLMMDDGPLTVHDLERLARAPRLLILTSCESGVSASVGADEIVGMASAVMPMGTNGLLASVVMVNDECTVPLSLAVHEGLARGGSLPEALGTARAVMNTDALSRATSASFLSIGV